MTTRAESARLRAQIQRRTRWGWSAQQIAWSLGLSARQVVRHRARARYEDAVREAQLLAHRQREAS